MTFGPNAFRRALMCTCRLFSSTTVPGQTKSSNSCLETTRSLRSISAISTSNARAPSDAGTPFSDTSRAAGWTTTSPKRIALRTPTIALSPRVDEASQFVRTVEILQRDDSQSSARFRSIKDGLSTKAPGENTVRWTSTPHVSVNRTSKGEDHEPRLQRVIPSCQVGPYSHCLSLNCPCSRLDRRTVQALQRRSSAGERQAGQHRAALNKALSTCDWRLIRTCDRPPARLRTLEWSCRCPLCGRTGAGARWQLLAALGRVAFNDESRGKRHRRTLRRPLFADVCRSQWKSHPSIHAPIRNLSSPRQPPS